MRCGRGVGAGGVWGDWGKEGLGGGQGMVTGSAWVGLEGTMHSSCIHPNHYTHTPQVTYGLHVVLRYEIERALIKGCALVGAVCVLCEALSRHVTQQRVALCCGCLLTPDQHHRTRFNDSDCSQSEAETLTCKPTKSLNQHNRSTPSFNQHNTPQPINQPNNTTQHNATQPTQHNTTQHNTTQHNTKGR